MCHFQGGHLGCSRCSICYTKFGTLLYKLGSETLLQSVLFTVCYTILKFLPSSLVIFNIPRIIYVSFLTYQELYMCHFYIILLTLVTRALKKCSLITRFFSCSMILFMLESNSNDEYSYKLKYS